MLFAALAAGLDKGMAGMVQFRGDQARAEGSNVGAVGRVDEGSVIQLIIIGGEGMEAVRFQAPILIVVRLEVVGGRAGLLRVPGVLYNDVEAGRVPWVRRGGHNVGQSVPLLIREGAQGEIGQSIPKAKREFNTFRGFTIGILAGEARGLVVDGPVKVFHLTRRENGLAIRHVGTLVDNEDVGAKVGEDIGTSLHQWQVADGVVIEAIEVD